MHGFMVELKMVRIDGEKSFLLFPWHIFMTASVAKLASHF